MRESKDSVAVAIGTARLNENDVVDLLFAAERLL
jgi:hypothetical protein